MPLKFCPPVGERVLLDQSVELKLELANLGWQNRTFLYGSGTSALAAALKAVIEIQKPKREILIPAYTCPDVVSAVLFAGGEPILVDFEPNRPWMQLDLVENRVTDNTAAIVAVNLLGIRERITDLSAITKRHNLLLVEDSAQAFPDSRENYQADVVITSFGRGKPVSTLGGGALFLVNESLRNFVSKVPVESTSVLQRSKYRVKVELYNALLSPYLYGIPASLPFLRLGETVFHPLTKIEPFPDFLQSILGSHIRRYRTMAPNIAQSYRALFSHDAFQSIDDLAVLCDQPLDRRFLRYPLMATDLQHRESLVAKLIASGIGASRMYRTVLCDIAGLQHLSLALYPNARNFADKLFTLPTHSGVDDKMIESIRSALSHQ